VARHTPILVLPVILLAGLFVSIEDITHFPLCFFKSFFRFDCLGCGLTRAFLSLPKGDIAGAFQFNAASPFLYLMFWLMFILLLYKLIKPDFVEPFYLKRLRLSMSQLILVFMTGHWMIKVWQYFAAHSMSEYLHSLLSQGNLLLLWI
jgi:hypothetical protein